MIEIKKEGLFYTTKHNSILIDNNDVLSFLSEPVKSIEDGFTIRNFLNLFIIYENLNLLNPEISESLSLLDKYKDLKKVDFDQVALSISGIFEEIDNKSEAKMFLNLQAVFSMADDFKVCYPANQVNLRNILNSKVVLLPLMHLSLDMEFNEISLRTHLPFNISQFTLFDVIGNFSNVISMASFNDMNSPDDDTSLEDSKSKFLEFKKMIEKQIGLDSVIDEDPIDVDESTKDILNQIDNILKKGDDNEDNSSSK